jgi:hypothetical protein
MACCSFNEIIAYVVSKEKMWEAKSHVIHYLLVEEEIELAFVLEVLFAAT